MFRKQALEIQQTNTFLPYGHYGEKSPELLKHYAQDLGFQYLSAIDKQSFLTAMKEFTTTEHKRKTNVL